MGYDLGALEFGRVRWVLGYMVSNDPDLSAYQRDMLRMMIEDPHTFLRNPDDFVAGGDTHSVGSGHALAVEHLMDEMLTRAPLKLSHELQALERTARRFGSRDSNFLSVPPKKGTAPAWPRKYSYEFDGLGVVERFKDILPKSLKAEVLPIDEYLVPRMYDMIPPDSYLNNYNYIVDPDNGYVYYVHHDPPDAFAELFGDRFMGMPTIAFKFTPTEKKVQLERWKPAFDIFEPYARTVSIGRRYNVLEDMIDVVIGRDPRPADAPLLYEFESDAARPSSLPQNVSLWRVEATVGKVIDDPQLVIRMMSTMSNPALAHMGKLPPWKKDPPHIFLQGARDLYDMRSDEDRAKAEAEIKPGRSVGILGTGKHATEVLGMLRNTVNGKALGGNSSGGGASSTRCSIARAPKLPAALGMGPGAMALTSGLMAARVRMTV